MRPPGLRTVVVATLILALLLAGLGLLTPNAFGVLFLWLPTRGYEMYWVATNPWQPLYTFDLPQGGSLVYKVRLALTIGPGSYHLAQVDWQTAEGKSYSFDAGDWYKLPDDMEFRVRNDGRAVWGVVRNKGKPPRIFIVIFDPTGGKDVLPFAESPTIDGGMRLNKHIVSKE